MMRTFYDHQTQPEMKSGFAIPCETCGALLVPDAENRYGACAMCAKTPSDAYMIRQLYLLSGRKAPILLSWDPEPDEIVFEHPHSKNIPEDSLIVVNPHQTAFYYANGNLILIKAGEIYAPRTGCIDIAGLARSLMQSSTAMLPKQLNTRLIFVDHRKHSVEPVLNVAVGKGEWTADIQTEMTLEFSSDDQAKKLLGHAFDFHDGTSVSNQILNRVKTHVLDELDSAVYDLSVSGVLDTENEGHLRRSLRIELNERSEEFRRAVNSRLEKQMGITLLEVYFRPLGCEKSLETVAVSCPFPGCTEIHQIPKGESRYECKTLSRKTLHPVTKKPILYYIRWCETCGAYTSDYEHNLICDVCHLRYRR